MKILVWLVLAIIIIGGVYSAFTNTDTDANNIMTATSTDATVQVTAIEHATGILSWGGSHIYFDPTGGAEAFSGQPAADIVLLTDIHGDHLSTSTLEAVRGSAVLIVPQAVQAMLPPALATGTIVMKNGDTIEQGGFTIEATPMYNYPESADSRHVKGRGNGYIIEKDGYRVLIAGDTAGTPELRAMRDIDMAFVPMNLPYTMSVDEAASAVLDFKPKVVYPYHYRGPDGLADVERFKQLVNQGNSDIEVVLAAWYPRQ